jgi:hypothetical protein
MQVCCCTEVRRQKTDKVDSHNSRASIAILITVLYIVGSISQRTRVLLWDLARPFGENVSHATENGRGYYVPMAGENPMITRG